MRSNVVTLAAATIITGASAAYAASETITMNAIDANGVGKEIGTLVLSDTQTGLEITPQLVGLPPGDRGFHARADRRCWRQGHGGRGSAAPLCGLAASIDGQHGHVTLVALAMRSEVFASVGWVIMVTRRHAGRWLAIRSRARATI